MSNTTKEVTECFFKLVQRIPFNIAPEKAKKLEVEVFDIRKWKISSSESEANFYAIPEDATIILSYSGLASLWCLAYAGFHIMDSASRLQREKKDVDQKNINIGEEYSQLCLDEYLAYSRLLCRQNSPWPSSLSKPICSPKANSSDDRVNNIFFGALSWIMLHEIAHVHHHHEKNIPKEQKISQEYVADNFATSWILEKAGRGRKREFRILMISVALLWLFMKEELTGRGPTHPATIYRFREASRQFKMGNRSVGLENAAYLFQCILVPSTNPPEFDTSVELFDWVCTLLEEKYAV